MSWQDRLRGNIQLTSPQGDFYNAKWRNNDRTKEKKIGQFEYPAFDGTRTQDLGINGTIYPLNIFFDGEDNDLEAERFWNSCDQRGKWEVIHPVKGIKELQLIRVREIINPIDSGNITEFDTQWIESIEVGAESSTAQLGADVNQQAIDTNIAASEQFDANTVQDTAAEQIATEGAINDGILAADNNLEDIASQDADVLASYDATKRGIADTLSQTPPDILTAAGQIQQLVQTPGLAVEDVAARIDAYSSMADEILTGIPEGIGSSIKNIISSGELFLSAILVGASQSAVSGTLGTRTEAIEQAESLTSLLADTVAGLDAAQANYDEEDIDDQYFSNSATYNNLTLIIASAVKFLLEASLDLKIEKRFILDRPRSPVEIAATEYGNLDELDFFIETNKLKGPDIRLLPAQREVVVYV